MDRPSPLRLRWRRWDAYDLILVCCREAATPTKGEPVSPVVPRVRESFSLRVRFIGTGRKAGRVENGRFRHTLKPRVEN